MKPLGCAPYPQTRRHPRTAGGADAPHLCTSKRYDPKADELLLGTDAVDVVVKATVARAGQIAAATENSIAEPAPSTAETSAGSSLVHPASCNPCANAVIRAVPFRIVSSQIDEHTDAPCPLRLLRARRERPRRRAAEKRDELAPLHSITSSAMASTPGGIVRPSELATLRLII